MGVRRVRVNLDRVCKGGSEVSLRCYRRIFSDRVDILSSRADILNDKDRALLRMYLKNGLSFHQIALVAGANQSTISRRIYKLTDKLVDGEYITILRNRERFSPKEIAVARDYFIDGMTQKQISAKWGMSMHSTRKILHEIKEAVAECKKSDR